MFRCHKRLGFESDGLVKKLGIQIEPVSDFLENKTFFGKSERGKALKGQCLRSLWHL